MMLSKWVAAYRVRRQAFELRLQHHSVGDLISGVVVSVGGLFLSGLLGAVTSTMIVRQLGPERYGEYALLISSIILLASVLGLGLDSWLLKEGGRAPDTLANNVYQVLLLKAAGALVLLLILAVGWQSRVEYTPAFLVGVAGIILGSFAQTGYAALRATRHNLQVALFRTLEPGLLLIALLATNVADLSVLLLMIVRAACAAALFVVLMRRVWQLVGHARGGFAPLPVIRGAWLFVGSDVLANIYSQSTFFILGSAAGTAAVGTFRPAVDLLTLIQSIPNLMFAVALPLLSAAAISRREFNSLLRVMVGGGALYGLAAVAGIWLAGDRLLTGLYGAQYHATLPFLLTLSLVPLIKTGSLICAAVMVSRDHVHVRVAAQCLVALLSVAVGWALIPSSGAAGAAWTVLFIEGAVFTLYAAGAVLAVRRRPL